MVPVGERRQRWGGGKPVGRGGARGPDSRAPSSTAERLGCSVSIAERAWCAARGELAPTLRGAVHAASERLRVPEARARARTLTHSRRARRACAATGAAARLRRARRSRTAKRASVRRGRTVTTRMRTEVTARGTRLLPGSAAPFPDGFDGRAREMHRTRRVSLPREPHLFSSRDPPLTMRDTTPIVRCDSYPEIRLVARCEAAPHGQGCRWCRAAGACEQPLFLQAGREGPAPAAARGGAGS